MKLWNGVWKKFLTWIGIWNGRFLVWNGRKLPVWNMEKSSSIPFYTMPCCFMTVRISGLILKYIIAEVGTNNNNATQQSATIFSTSKCAVQNAQLTVIFLFSEAQRNFRNELFDSVEAQRSSAIAERYFRTKLKRNLSSTIEILQHNANTEFFAVLD